MAKLRVRLTVDIDYDTHAETTVLKAQLNSMLHYGLTRGGFPDWTANIDTFVIDGQGYPQHVERVKRGPRDY